MSLLATSCLCAAYNGRQVLNSICVEFLQGKSTALIGANGSGKSTLLKTIARLLPPTAGQVLLEGKKIHSLNTRTVAQQLSILPQGPRSPGDITVRELAGFGRHPFIAWLGRVSKRDCEIVEWALAQTRMTSFAERPVDQLSGGERQRAWIAMALAQQPRVLLLDEPTTFLDICYQLEVLELIAKLKEELGLTVVMAMHDLNQAARYCDQVVALRAGRIAACGTPREVVTPAFLKEVFSINAEVMWSERFAAPQCIPIHPLNGQS
jgi:iron complex transport system ATP-binding protein